VRVLFEGRERDFAPSATEFWQRSRIPRSPLTGSPRTLRWLHSDSEENYYARGNKELAPESISYEFNSFGYRSDEFDQYGVAPGLMFIGCSNTLGIGIPLDCLWTTLVTRHFQTVWDMPIRQYNLAWSATGGDHVAMMVHQCTSVLKPRAVFVLWSYVNRLTWFETPKRRYHFLPSSTKFVPEAEHNAFLRLSTDSQAFFNFVRNYNFVENALKAMGVPFFCGILERFETDTLEYYVPLGPYVGRWNRLDTARDNQHSGVKSHADFADRIIEKAIHLSKPQI
jgi:hypothetical protein